MLLFTLGITQNTDLDTFITTCIHHHAIILSIFTEYFHGLKILSAHPIHPHSRPATTLGNHSSFYCLFSFAFFRISYNGNYTVYNSFRLAYFT